MSSLRRRFALAYNRKTDNTFRMIAEEDNCMFTITMTSDLTTAEVTYLEYSLDFGKTWEKITNISDLEVVTNITTVNAEDCVMLRGKGYRINGRMTITADHKFRILGCIMSLFMEENKVNENTSIKTISNRTTFNQLFYNSINLTNAESLILPKDVNGGCYNAMFSGCTSLVKGPELPATLIGKSSYNAMFAYCTSLTKAPSILPALTLEESCYNLMFRECTALTTAPILPASTLTTLCYRLMFQNCSLLNYVKMLATDISAENCLFYWLYGSAINGTFVKHPDMNDLPRGNSGIPNNWTVEEATE